MGPGSKRGARSQRRGDKNFLDLVFSDLRRGAGVRIHLTWVSGQREGLGAKGGELEISRDI